MTPSPSRARSRSQSANGSPPPVEFDETHPDESSSPSRGELSESSGTGSWGASSFVSDAGPAFDPKTAPAAPEPDADLREEGALFEEWDEGRIREFLELQGEVMHAILAVDELDEDTWIHTEKDMRAIAPPLTRILNRYDVTRAAAAAGDEILLASAVARYGSRNYIRRRRHLARIAAAGPQPVTGVAAPEGTGPEDDETWRGNDEPLAVVAPPALTPRGARR